MVIKLPRSRESTPVAVTPPSTTLAPDRRSTASSHPPCNRLAVHATFPNLSSNDKSRPQNRGSSPRIFAQSLRPPRASHCAPRSPHRTRWQRAKRRPARQSSTRGLRRGSSTRTSCVLSSASRGAVTSKPLRQVELLGRRRSKQSARFCAPKFGTSIWRTSQRCHQVSH